MNPLHEFIRAIFLEFVYNDTLEELSLSAPVGEREVPKTVARHDDIRSKLGGVEFEYKKLSDHFTVLVEDGPRGNQCAMTIADSDGTWWDVLICVELLQEQVKLSRVSVEKFS